MQNVAIRVQNLTKMYKLYDKPTDRLVESLGLSKKKCYKEHYALNGINMVDESRRDGRHHRNKRFGKIYNS